MLNRISDYISIHLCESLKLPVVVQPIAIRNHTLNPKQVWDLKVPKSYQLGLAYQKYPFLFF